MQNPQQVRAELRKQLGLKGSSFCFLFFTLFFLFVHRSHLGTDSSRQVNPINSLLPFSLTPSHSLFSFMLKVKALHPYVAQRPQELSFTEGEVIAVTKKDPIGWWDAELKGKKGDSWNIC